MAGRSGPRLFSPWNTHGLGRGGQGRSITRITPRCEYFSTWVPVVGLGAADRVGRFPGGISYMTSARNGARLGKCRGARRFARCAGDRLSDARATDEESRDPRGAPGKIRVLPQTMARLRLGLPCVSTIGGCRATPSGSLVEEALLFKSRRTSASARRGGKRGLARNRAMEKERDAIRGRPGGRGGSSRGVAMRIRTSTKKRSTWRAGSSRKNHWGVGHGARRRETPRGRGEGTARGLGAPSGRHVP